MNREQRNRRTALTLAAAALGMVGFGFLLVPLYDTFCDLTGLNGKTSVIAEESAARLQGVEGRWVTVQLDASINAALPWHFYPVERRVRVRTGTISTILYRARNQAQHVVTGRAIPSMAPSRAASYFNKIECFCFQEQTLAAGEQRDLLLRFIIDPELPRDLEVLTLSYAFFRVPGDTGAEAVDAQGENDDV